MKDYISHIQSPLSNDDYNLFMKAVSTKGSEATAYLWVQWYFDFKNDPKNLTEEQSFSMAEAVQKNAKRIYGIKPQRKPM